MTAEILATLARGMIAASAAIVLVLALRGWARRTFGPRAAYRFWLIVPATVVAAYLPARVVTMRALETNGAAVAASLPPVTQSTDPIANVAAATSTLPFADIIFFIWLGGVIASLMAVMIDQQRVLDRMGLTREGDVLRARTTSGPAVVGVLRPRIVVPADFEHRYDAAERDLVLEHERTHIRAGDAQINALAAFAQCLNWFNPLFYLARKALRVDQEIACDAHVMRRHGNARRAYAEAMLKTQIASHAIPLGCHWPALGAQPLKQRIDMLRQTERPRSARIAGSMLCVATAACAGVAAWLAQPPQLAYANTDAPAGTNSLRATVLGSQLVAALQDGDIASAQLLLEGGADVNFFQPGDGTPLIMAVRLNEVGMVESLVEAGASVNQRAPGEGNALIVAAAQGDMDIVATLVNAGADVNGFVRSDETPLINAARENRLDVARYLIEHGADVNLEVDAPTVRGLERRSPISVARQNGHSEMIRLLRRHGART